MDRMINCALFSLRCYLTIYVIQNFILNNIYSFTKKKNIKKKIFITRQSDADLWPPRQSTC